MCSSAEAGDELERAKNTPLPAGSDEDSESSELDYGENAGELNENDSECGRACVWSRAEHPPEYGNQFRLSAVEGIGAGGDQSVGTSADDEGDEEEDDEEEEESDGEDEQEYDDEEEEVETAEMEVSQPVMIALSIDRIAGTNDRDDPGAPALGRHRGGVRGRRRRG